MSAALLSQVYAFHVCLFQNVTQLEYREKQWKALEEQSKQTGSASVTVNADGSVRKQASNQQYIIPVESIKRKDLSSPTLLGVFLGWEEAYGYTGVRHALFNPANPETKQLWSSTSLPVGVNDDGGEGPVMRYAYGAKCGDSPDNRRAAVRLVCGSDVQVVSVLEDGDCKYDIIVSAPAACFRRARGVIASDLAHYTALLNSATNSTP